MKNSGSKALILFPPWVQENYLHPFGGEHVQRTFSKTRLTSARWEKDPVDAG